MAAPVQRTEAAGRPARLLGRERVFGLASEASDLSAAFAPGPEARFLLRTDGNGSDPRRLAEAVAGLVDAMRARLGVASWRLAFGDSPDQLWPIALARRRYAAPVRALEQAEDEEAIALLAALAAGPDDAPLRFLPRAIRAFFARRPTTRSADERRKTDGFGRRAWPGSSAPNCFLAIETDAPSVARHLQAFFRFGGADTPFWLADASLGVRFCFRGGAATFRAHHPVIQEALEDRCRKDGVDLA